MDMDRALQNLLDGTATENEIKLLKQGLASRQISIGGNINHSVIIIGNGNTVELTPQALDRLNAGTLLGNLDRDLTRDEISLGLELLEKELPLRAPILSALFKEQARRLRSFLKTNANSLSEAAQKERLEALALINGLCIEVLDIPFNTLCVGEEPPEYDSRSPFRGLESFRPQDSEFFFGREELTAKMVRKIRSYPFLAVLGASGSGKSSLVMAGLIPSLGSEYAIFRPGANPLEALETASEKPLIIVDQFEELFTLTKDESARKEFITKLLEKTKRNKVIITLRSDFLGEVADYRVLNEEVQNHLENVPPMDMDELHRSMEGQARWAGLRFEADLSQQILDDVEGEPGAMSLLQHALWELWNRRHGHWLLAEEYRAFGGVKMAITTTAENLYTECTRAEQTEMHDIFLRLTRFDDSDKRRDTRKQVAIDEIPPSGHDPASTMLLLEKLANARLIVKTVEKDKIEIEVAHEALIRHWKRLRIWLEDNRENSKLWESVTDAARQWEAGKRNDGLVNYRDPRLKSIMRVDGNPIYALNALENDYIDACAKAETAEETSRKRSKQLTVTTSILLILLLLIVVPLGWFYANGRPLSGKWVLVPAGAFKMGMDEKERELADELCRTESDDTSRCTSLNGLVAESGSQEDAWLPDFSIMNNEVTNAQYQQCVDADGCQSPKDWREGAFNEPATRLNWHQAGEYCQWLGGRLPTEGEWEKAARGANSYTFPWGNEWDPLKTNLKHSEIGNVKSVLEFANTDVNSYGMMNMAGNVQEWTTSEGISISLNQPFENKVFLHKDDGESWPVVVRGGSWRHEPSQGMAAKRGTEDINQRKDVLGFRCACPSGQTCNSPWSLMWILFGID